MKKGKLFLRLSVFCMALIQLMAFLPLTGSLPRVLAAAPGKGSTQNYLVRARDFFRSHRVIFDRAEKGDPNEVLRVLVVTDAPAAVESAGEIAYTDRVQAAEKKTLAGQESVIRAVEKLTGNRVINRSGYLVNAFSIQMKRGQMDAVRKLSGVKAVMPVTSFRQTMQTATDMTSAVQMWEQENGGFTGEGIAIAIIDSGVNYDHPDMKLDEGARVKFTQEDIEKKIDELGYGTYYSEKVPFGYDYVGSWDEDVYNPSVSHGLHVTGIAAANGEVTGIAPNAQILGMKVFGDSGEGYADDMIRAVEDAVKIGADILNLSLGGTVGFYDDMDYLQKALAYAEENGVISCVAAGNDGAAPSDLGINTNDWGIPDTGSVSSPATYPGAFSVASVDNTYYRLPAMDIIADGEPLAENYLIWDFSEGNAIDWDALQDVPVVDLGIGDMMDILGRMDELFSIEGDWVALIERGEITFEEKIFNATLFGGASAVILYNNEATDEVPDSMSAGESNTDRAVMVSGNLGAVIKEKAAEGALFSFNGLYDIVTANPTGGKVSVFSAWGPTPTLDIKPEISAPGGEIYSISVDDGYEVMSGTSMATPYISGASALVLQALQAAVREGTLNPGDLPLNVYLKLAMMNTADPIYDGEGIFSVRQQGAGLVDPLSASKTRVLATYGGLAAVTLKEVGNTAEFTITLTNYGTEDVTYSVPVYAPVYSDCTDPETGVIGVSLNEDAVITFDKTEVTVPAGGTETLTGTLKIHEQAEENHFVESFIRLSGEIDLSLPLLGFYGDWDTAGRIIDLPGWEEENILTNFYGSLSATTVAGGDSFLGILGNDLAIDPDKMAFSPNGDGLFDNVQPLVGMLRSAGVVDVDILDADMTQVRRINHLTNVSRALGYDLYESRAPYTALNNSYTGDGTWDGTRYDPATGQYVACEEGLYYIRIRASLPGSDKVEETLLPFLLDVSAPEIEILGAVYTDGEVTVTFTVSEENSLADDALVFINGKGGESSGGGEFEGGEGEFEEEFSEEEEMPGEGEFEGDIGEGEEEPSYDGYSFLLSETPYDEETGVYTLVLPGEYYEPGSLNEIALILNDYALNQGLDLYYAEAEYTAPILFANVNNDDTVTLLRDVSYDMVDVDFDRYAYENCVAEIRGTAEEGIASVTVNGVEAPVNAKGVFVVSVPVELGYSELTVIARDASGKEVYRTVKQVLVDVAGPEITAYVADENGEWDDDMIYMSTFTMGGWIFATRYGEDETVPMAFEISDESLESVTVYWLEGSFEDDEIWSTWMDYWMFGFYGGMPDPAMYGVPEEYIRSVSFAADELNEQGKLLLDVPFAQYMSLEWDDETDEEYLKPVCRQMAVCVGVDAVGNVGYWNTILDGGETAVERFEYTGGGDVREDDALVDAGFKWIDPIWDGEGDMMNIVVTPEMVDENNVLHMTAALAEDTYEIFEHGEALPQTEKDGERLVSFDRKLHPGTNFFTITGSDELGWFTYRFPIYFAVNGEKLSANFDDGAIEDGAVIYTAEDSFTVSGEVFSFAGSLNLKINGDQLLYLTETGIDVNFGVTKPFAYEVALAEGENTVTVLLSDATGETVEVRFTVIRDTAAPGKPVLTEAEDHTVTVSAAEGEEVTLLYSLDGSEWKAYTGPIPMTESGTVYAKAVDRAGNESEVAELAVTVPAPGPDEPGTDEPGKDEPGTDEPGTDEPGKDEPGKDEPGTDKPPIPATGENAGGNIFAVMGALVLAMSAAVVSARRKEEE